MLNPLPARNTRLPPVARPPLSDRKLMCSTWMLTCHGSTADITAGHALASTSTVIPRFRIARRALHLKSDSNRGAPGRGGGGAGGAAGGGAGAGRRRGQAG